jgi:HAMP domain-containing protein
MRDTFAEGANEAATVVVTMYVTPSSPTALSVHTLFVLPADPSSVPTFLAPVLEHVGTGRPNVLVLTPDVDTAVELASVAMGLGRSDVLAATSVGRAARVTPPAVVIGPPEVIQGLIARSRLKLDGLGALVIAWVGSGAALEAVMAEVPKDAARTIVAAGLTPDVEALVERYARRPRRVAGAPPVAPLPTARYVTVTDGTRPSALRRLLDDLDPPSAIVYTRTDRSERTVRELLGALGYAGANTAVRVARDTVAESAALVVLYDVPLDAAEMTSIVQSAPVQIVALAERGELTRLPGAQPLALSGSLDRATRRLDELRRVLEAGVPAAEVTWLQPLLDTYDGIEIAAAAVHLLEREKRAPAAPVASPAQREPRDRPPRRDDRRDRGHGQRPAGDRRSPSETTTRREAPRQATAGDRRSPSETTTRREAPRQATAGDRRSPSETTNPRRPGTSGEGRRSGPR